MQPLNKPLTHDISRIPLHRPQTKLSISQPGDEFEKEADSVARQVMQRIGQPVNPQSIQREALPESEDELQMKSLNNSRLQRQPAPKDEEELQMKPMVQRRVKALMTDAPDLEASINQARGSGQSMADNIREPMEVAFGADFSAVKVHTDGKSDQLNRSIQARAFTTGQDVFFRQGEYNPGSRGGQQLLAHELTHVVQQSGGAVQRSPLNFPQQSSASASMGRWVWYRGR
ncbi:eCIS core domain-containing protein [Nostoc sp. FACHB-892]|uniref:eCIS core domain-containing protein n=1 Tax=Nostoc sp. FACHB-892 TaxID=2692843 RepID=UPI0018F01EDF